MKKKNNFKRKAKKALLTATAATSLLVNNAYDNPLDIIDDVNMGDSLEDMDEDKKKTDMKSSVRRLMGQIPLPIRATVLVPLWFIGWALMLVIDPLMEYIVIPNLKFIIGWAAVFFLVVGIIAVAAMIIFPGLPLSKILNKKTIKLTFILIVLCAIGDKIAEHYYSDYRDFKLWIKVASGAITTIIVLFKIYRLNRKLKIKVFTDKYQFAQEF